MSLQRIDYLLSAKAVRDQSHRILQMCKEGLTHFKLHADRLTEVASLVAKVTKENYPDLQVPFHSRWGHFRVGTKGPVSSIIEIPRIQQRILMGLPLGSKPKEIAKRCFDLVIPSVLLDAGAGMQWKFQERPLAKTDIDPKTVTSKSEGLALASLAWFDEIGGKVNVETLSKTTPALIEKTFQVTPQNPLLAVEGRSLLLRSLGECLAKHRMSSPGEMVDRLEKEYGTTVPATGILKFILTTFGSIWPGRMNLMGTSLGDCWKYSGFEDGERLIPFHKLSQWMTYSLIEPLQLAGFEITDINLLTGLPEYRNGGLLLDSRLISLRDPGQQDSVHEVSSDLVIEWRALTVALLDELAPEVRKILGLPEEKFPLAKILEGGTWWAGRRLAAEKRQDGGPPLRIQTDGTVF